MAVQYLHLWFLLKLTLVAGQTVHYVLKDEEAILTPALKGHPDNILWRHNGNKVIEFNGAQETVYKPFEERITLAWDTAKLAIANVRYEDSGEYELDAFIRERLYRSQYLLKVLDKVSMPLIRCEINEESSDGNNTLATLFCSSESNTPEALMFKWKLDGKSHVGPDLPITLGYGHDDITYSCTVNNPLQEETSTFTAKDCYTGRTVESTEIPSTAIVVPIIVILILLVIGIFYKYWDKLKRACCKRGKNDDCENPPEKNRGVKRDTNDTDEHVPLMQSDIHRQETILSPQRLPIQEEVDETPKTGIVKDRCKMFESPTNTKANRGRHVPAPTPGPGRKDSGGELRPQDAENVPKSEEEGDAKTDSDQNENKDAPEPQSPNNGPQVEQHSLSTQEEQEGTGQTDSEKKSDRRHKDHVGGVGASSPTPSTEQPERRVPEPTPGPGRKDSGGELRPQDSENVPKSEKEGDSDQNENKDAPEPQSPNNGPQVKQDLLPTQEEQEGTGQTDSEKKSDERHEDHENEQTTEASKAPEQPEQQSTKSETQVNQDQPAPEEQEHGGQTDSETSKLDESSKAPEQPGPQPAVSKTDKDQPLDSGPSGDEGKGHEESTTLGEEQQKQDSYSNKSKESTSNAESESKTPESEEQFDESTHPPASSSSHHADNKETKDTDGELTAYSNPPHDDQTRDDTDKESDSSGTEKRNGADKMESGEAVVDMDHKNSKA